MSIPPKSVLFFGTPTISLPYLRLLIEDNFVVVGVVTRPDKRRGRGVKLLPSPVAELAMAHSIDVYHSLNEVSQLTYDLGVVVAYGRIIPNNILEKALHVNVHYSLLPKYRGAAPMERAILKGEPTSGVCLMKVDEGLDTGAVYGRRVIDIAGKYLSEVASELTLNGVEMLKEFLGKGYDWSSEAVPQVGEATYAEKISLAELQISWDQSAIEVYSLIRLEKAYSFFQSKRVKFETVQCGEIDLTQDDLVPGEVHRRDGQWMIHCGGGGEIFPGNVRVEGKGTTNFNDFANGVRLIHGQIFG